MFIRVGKSAKNVMQIVWLIKMHRDNWALYNKSKIHAFLNSDFKSRSGSLLCKTLDYISLKLFAHFKHMLVNIRVKTILFEVYLLVFLQKLNCTVL